MLKENLLHHIWKFKLFTINNLKTVQGDKIKIIQSGQHNFDAGPDFFNAKIQIGETTWAGNVEIHINGSDWLKHKHQNNKVYDNVILHIVYNNDVIIKDPNQNEIPTLELKKLINQDLIIKYTNLIDQSDQHWIPCQNQITTIDTFIFNNWIDRLVLERLERKSEEIKQTLLFNKNNWEDTFYQYLFKHFGLKVNADPFQLLAKNTPLKIIDKHNTLFSIEALLFGQAGMLAKEVEDEYYQKLKNEYSFLKTKFSLLAMDDSLWKLLRLRPSNFPAIRISQIASLLNLQTRLFSKIIEAKNVKELQLLFKVQASKYWDSHYQFGVLAKNSKVKRIGVATINNIIINVIVPFLFLYSKSIQNEGLTEKSLQFLEEIKSESNTIIKKWNDIGVESKNAKTSQALLELKTKYCSQKKCLNCNVGNKLLQ